MSFQGTRTKRGSVNLDRSAVGRGIVIQLLLGVLVVPLGTVVSIQPGYLLIPTTLIAGGYVGVRTENWGDEYMDGAAMGVVGGVVVAVVAGALAGAFAMVVQGQSPVQAFLGSMLTLGIVVIVMLPILGIFGAAAAWLTAKHIREPA